MRGVVFLMFEAFVVERRGFDAYEALLEATAGKLDAIEPFLGTASYRDDDLRALIDAEALASASPREALLRELGRFCIPRLARRYAWAFAGHRSLTGFLAQLRRIVHGRVEFELGRATDGFTLAYRSPRGLCALAEGLVDGLASHFDGSVAIAQLACVDRGDERCEWKAVVA